MKKKILLTVTAALLCCASLATAQLPPTINTLPHPLSPSLITIESQARTGARLPRDPLPVLSGSDRKRIQALRAPNPDDLARYKDFLRRDGTGIFRLFPDAACVEKGVIKVGGACANHVPGASTYSFRGRTAMADIRFEYGDLIAGGFLSLPIMVNLGDVGLENVTLANDGIKFMAAYQPASIFGEARKQHASISAGERVGDFLYTNRLKAVDDNTYAIRIVAYKHGSPLWERLRHDRAASLSQETKMKFFALRYDNRRDIIVALRLIRRDDDGSITVLWKELSDNKPPSLKFGKNEGLADLK